ncbi:HAAS signaling domain-containing protein [Streptomyces sp. NPDC057695]|uniref:HAAS signaling domain-containing protein n=1 Tax=Streptomyces sp. NPDC057695 TaxID=3346217 RepID=UPI0036AC82B2
MNATAQSPLVAAYLDAVARETAELPAERRAELLADLREHIEASGAEGEEQLRAVLAGLGEPRTVAASALAEEAPAGGAPLSGAGRAAVSGAGRGKLTMILLGASGVLLLLNPWVGALALIAALVLLWGAPQWTGRQKALGTAAGVAVPVVVVLGALLGAASRIGIVELLLMLVFSLVVPVLGAVVLLRAARR